MAALLAVVAVGVGSAIQALTGFGFSLVSAPFLIAAYQAPAGVQLTVLIGVILNTVFLFREVGDVDARAAAHLLVPALAVTLPAGYVVRRLATGPLTVAAGLVCLAGVTALASGRRLRLLSGRRGAATAGVASAAMNAVAGMSGPPVVLYAVNAGWSPTRARPTLQLYFLCLNGAALAVLGWPAHLPAALVPSVVAGVALGARLARRPSDALVRRATLLAAGTGSLLAIARGVIG